MKLSIVQWRVPGDDEDNLDVMVVPSDFDHIADIKATLIEERAEAGEECEPDTDDNPLIYVTNEFFIPHGFSFPGVDGKRYKILIEEIVAPVLLKNFEARYSVVGANHNPYYQHIQAETEDIALTLLQELHTPDKLPSHDLP